MTAMVNAENCLQLVLQNSELVLDEKEINPEEFSDIIYPDGTRAILVNGHFFQPDDTVILQEDLTHLYVDGDGGQILLSDDQDLSPEENINDSKVIEFIDVDQTSNLVGDEPQIVYITEDSLLTQDSISQYHLTNAEDNHSVETHVIDLEEFMKGGKENVFEFLGDENRFQYAVLKEGIASSENEEFIPSAASDDSQSQPNDNSVDNNANSEQILDISLITGKNLLTGQKVTLHSYMDKIQKQLKNGITPSSNTRKRKAQTTNLYSLLNKKLNIGTTMEGKKLVGKIIKVTKKNTNGPSEIVQNTDETAKNIEIENSQLDMPNNQSLISDIQIIEKDQLINLSEKDAPIVHVEGKISKDSFQPITKTLEGLMAVENVRKKLENKTVIVKIVERNKSSEKNVIHMYGYMKNSVVINGSGTTTTHWTFITSNLGHSVKPEWYSKKKSLDIANVTLIITYLKKNERVIRVVLNPTTTKYVCSKCPRVFKSRLQLRIHKNSVHKVLLSKDSKTLEKSTSPTVAEKNRTISEAANGILETIYFQCGVCFHNFASTYLLTEHLKQAHSISHPYVCYSCGKCFTSIGDLNNHKKEHASVIKYYQCDRCKRTFTRYSNLQRHLAIHQGAEQMYQCSICGCSYHYVSSLTKHIVQNHIQTEAQKVQKKK